LNPIWPTREDGTLVIGDLHLDPLGGPEVDEFSAFCAALKVPRLVILGDLFEAWFGPRTAHLGGAQEVSRALLQLTQRGVAVDVIPGNRDFLLDEGFARASGVGLHPEGWRGALDGVRVLILHGDTLCTRDLGYLRLRRVLHSRVVYWLVRWLPRALLLLLVGRLRAASRKAVARKPVPRKAMQTQAAVAAASAADPLAPAQLLVVGHAHEFSDRSLDSTSLRWLVLDGWGGLRDTLRLGTGAGPQSLCHRDLMSPARP
jgi:UDP-2,3-diacylglucosamine hydrolase